MKGPAWGFIYTLLLFAFANAAGLDRLGKWTELLAAVANLATVLGIGFAIIQWRSWRPQQLALKAQSVAEELLVKQIAFRTDAEILATPPDLDEGSLPSMFGMPPPAMFLHFVENHSRELSELKQRFEELAILMIKLSALGVEKHDAGVIQKAHVSLAEANDAVWNLSFSRRLAEEAGPGLFTSGPLKSDCEKTNLALRAISPSAHTSMQAALDCMQEVALSALSLKGRPQ